MNLKKLVKKEDLDSPIMDTEKIGFFKKGKVRVIIFFEDGSHKDYYLKLGQSYFFQIGTANYIIIPKCISNGKNPTCAYYYNNPFPINFEYKYTQFTALDMRTKEEIAKLNEDEKVILANTFIDAQAIKSAFDSRLLNSLYASNQMTVKSLILIMIVVTIIIVMILHFTGVINVTEFFIGGSE